MKPTGKSRTQNDIENSHSLLFENWKQAGYYNNFKKLRMEHVSVVRIDR